jgi:hypothetical protein
MPTHQADLYEFAATFRRLWNAFITWQQVHVERVTYTRRGEANPPEATEPTVDDERYGAADSNREPAATK